MSCGGRAFDVVAIAYGERWMRKLGNSHTLNVARAMEYPVRCGYGRFGSISNCFGDLRVRLWLTGDCARQCAAWNCGAPDCSRQHRVVKFPYPTAENSACAVGQSLIYKDLVLKRPAPKPKPLPKPKVRADTAAAVREIQQHRICCTDRERKRLCSPIANHMERKRCRHP